MRLDPGALSYLSRSPSRMWASHPLLFGSLQCLGCHYAMLPDDGGKKSLSLAAFSSHRAGLVRSNHSRQPPERTTYQSICAPRSLADYSLQIQPRTHRGVRHRNLQSMMVHDEPCPCYSPAACGISGSLDFTSLLLAWTPLIIRIQETTDGSFFGTRLVPRRKLDRKVKL
jgi:hypothetical protein